MKVETTVAGCEISSTATFDFPPERVFEAWSDPALLARWWGPKGFTNVFKKFEFKPGGEWVFIMRGPDGKEHPNHSVFKEIIDPKLIIFDHVSEHGFQMRVGFSPEGEGTRFSLRMIHKTVAECEAVKPYVVEGNRENFERLDALLRGEASQ